MARKPDLTDQARDAETRSEEARDAETRGEEAQLPPEPTTVPTAPQTQDPPDKPPAWEPGEALHRFADLLRRHCLALPAALRMRSGEDTTTWLRRAFALQRHCLALSDALHPLQQHTLQLQRHIQHLRHNMERLSAQAQAWPPQAALRILGAHARGARSAMDTLHGEIKSLRQPSQVPPHRLPQHLERLQDPDALLATAHRALEDHLLHRVLHDVSSPASVILGSLPELHRHLEHLGEHPDTTWGALWAQQRDVVLDLTDATARILDILCAVAAWGRPPADALQPLLPVEEMIHLALRLSYRDYQSARLELEPNLRVRGDRGQLAQLLLSLLNHPALPPREPADNVRICARGQGPWICLEVIHALPAPLPQPLRASLHREGGLARAQGGLLELSHDPRRVMFSLRLPRPVLIPT